MLKVAASIILFLQTIGTMFLSAHYLMYGIDGIGLKSTHLNGRVLEAAADLMFVLLLILIAKGYTVTRARLPQPSSIKLAVFVCAYCVIYSALFIYERIHFDPGEVSNKSILSVFFVYIHFLGFIHLRIHSGLWTHNSTNCGLVYVYLFHILYSKTLSGKGRILLPLLFILYTMVCVWTLYYHHSQPYYCRMG